MRRMIKFYLCDLQLCILGTAVSNPDVSIVTSVFPSFFAHQSWHFTCTDLSWPGCVLSCFSWSSFLFFPGYTFTSLDFSPPALQTSQLSRWSFFFVVCPQQLCCFSNCHDPVCPQHTPPSTHTHTHTPDQNFKTTWKITRIYILHYRIFRRF